jgi:hypothetical protein
LEDPIYQERLGLDGMYLLLVGADDVNLFGKYITATQKNTKLLLDNCK